MKLFTKMFLATGIPFGVLTGAVDIYFRGVEGGFRSGLLKGLFFGFCMAVIYITVKRKGCDSNPIQSKTESIEGTYDVVFQRCLQALDRLKAKIKKSNKESGVILAKMSMTWKSFGEILEVKLVKEGDQLIKVTLTTSPIQKAALVDYGKGLQNVNAFFEAL